MTQTPVSNLQASLTLTEFVDIEGIFPSRDGGGSGPFLGSIGIFAGPAFEFADPADGQTLAIQSNRPCSQSLGRTLAATARSISNCPTLAAFKRSAPARAQDFL